MTLQSDALPDNLFAAIFRHTQEPLLVADDAGLLVHVNPGACELLGLPEEDLLQRHVWELTPPAQMAAAGTLWQAVIDGEADERALRLQQAGDPARAVEITPRLNVLPGLHLLHCRGVTPQQHRDGPLTAGEAQLRALVDHMPIPVLLKDADGRYLFANRAALDITGRQLADVTRRHADELLGPDTAAAPEEADHRLLSGETDKTVFEFTLDDDPDQRTFTSIKFRVPLPAGSAGVGGISIDTSQDLLLQRSRRLNERIAATVPFLLYVYDIWEQHHLFINENSSRFFGIDLLSADAPFHQLLQERLHPDDHVQLAKNYQALWKTTPDGQVHQWKARLRNAAGQYRWLQVYETVLDRDAAGMPLTILGSAIDVTETVQAQHAADTERQRLAGVVQSAPVTIVTLNRDGIITTLKGHNLDRLGIDTAQFINQQVADFAPDGLDGPQLTKLILDGEALDLTVPYAGRHFHVRTSPLFDAGGRRDGAVIVATDITERIHTETELQRRLDTERLLADIARRFIGLRVDTIPARIGEALAGIGRHADVDFCYLALLDHPQPEHILISHLWEREKNLGKNYRRTPVSIAPYHWSMNQIRAGKAVLIDDARSLPDEAAAERERLAALGCDAVIEVPVQWNDETVGLIGFRSHQGPRRWRDDQKTLLQITGQILFGALQRYESEMAHRSSDARFRAVFEKSGSGMVIARIDGKFMEVNETFLQMVGYAEEELQAISFTDLSYPEDLERELPLVAALVRGEIDSYQLQKRYLRRDGSLIWGLASVAGVRDARGTIQYFIAQVQDINEFKQAEAALRESERTYRTLTENMPDAVARFDRQGRHLFVTRGSATRLGLDSDQMLNRSPRELGLDSGGNMDEWERRVQAVFDTGVPDELELAYPGPEGTTYMLQRLVGERNVEGEIISVLGITSNVTEKRLRDEERRLLLLAIEQSPLGIVITDPQFRIQYLNPAYTHISGYTAAEALGHTPALWRSNAHDSKFFERIDSQLQSHRRWQGIVRNRHKNGSEYWEKVTIAPVVNGDGELTQYVSFREDVTSLLAQEDELQQHERLAAVGQLAAGIAHDFNNIMAVITLFGQLILMEETISPKGIERLKAVISQSQRAGELIQQILDFSRQSSLERQTLDLQPLLKELGKLLERTMPESIQLRMQYENEPLRVLADPTRIQQIVMNLCVNARDAMNGKGLLTVGMHAVAVAADEEGVSTLLPPGEYVRLSVKDTGSGIPDDTLPHIFEPFFTTKEPGQGTGLGLAQVYGIVQQHEGHILVDSQVGVGTLFTVYLPLLKETIQPAAETAYNLPPGGRGELVLVVEDSAATRTALIDTLTALNYRVHAVENGRQALDALETLETQPAVIWSDVVMPQMGGVALLQTLRERGLQLPVIMCSGYLPPEDMATLHEVGMSAWLPKPPHLQQLAETLRRVLSEHPPA